MDYEYSKCLGAHLAKIRKDNHLTQEQLSAKLQVLGCDLTRSALAKIEVGQRHIYPAEDESPAPISTSLVIYA